MRTTEIFAAAIEVIRRYNSDPSQVTGEATVGMCAHLMSPGEVRDELLKTYSRGELKKAAAHAQHFVFQIRDDLGLDADESMYEYLYEVLMLMQKHSPESAVERWFLIYEDWENRYDYV